MGMDHELKRRLWYLAVVQTSATATLISFNLYNQVTNMRANYSSIPYVN